MSARLNKFEMPRKDIEATMRVCAKMLEARRTDAMHKVVISMRAPGTSRVAPRAWSEPKAALAA